MSEVYAPPLLVEPAAHPQLEEALWAESEMEPVSSQFQLPVSVVIPAFNEEAGVRAQIEAVQQALGEQHITYEILVVDDGSTDQTAKEATKTGVRVLQHPQNRGYGAALKTGIRAAEHDLVVIIDADGTYPASAIPELLAQALKCDMVVGARAMGRSQIALARRPAKWFLRMLATYLAGQHIPDLNSGLRVMRKSMVQRFDYILPSGFSFTTTITLALLCNDHTVSYCPIAYYPRLGRSKIRPVDAYHFLLLILRTIVFFNPLKVFLPLGGMMFFLGVGKLIYDLFIGNLSETAVLGFLGAFVIWAIGLLSDQLAKLGLALRAG